MGTAEQAPNKAYSTDEIVKVICEGLQEHNPEKIELSADTDMTTDLNVDSVAIMDLMFTLEEHFDISIPLNALVDVFTVAELAALVESEIKAAS